MLIITNRSDIELTAKLTALAKSSNPFPPLACCVAILVVIV